LPIDFRLGGALVLEKVGGERLLILTEGMHGESTRGADEFINQAVLAEAAHDHGGLERRLCHPIDGRGGNARFMARGNDV
jgi:hypothetical protein